MDDGVTKERERLLLNELRETYGSRLLYICSKADLAVQVLAEKTEDPAKAKTLQQHTQKVKEWTEYVGLLGGKLIKLKAAMEKYVELADLTHH